MEPSNQDDGTDQNDDDSFFDAIVDSSSHNSTIINESDDSASASTLSVSIPDASPEISSPATILRRRSIPGKASKDTHSGSSLISSSVTQNSNSKRRHKDKRYRRYHDLKENEKKNMEGTESTRTSQDRVCSTDIENGGVINRVGEEEGGNEKSTVTMADDDRVGDSVDSAGEEGDSSSSNLLLLVAGFMIKALSFQFNLVINFITFPMWALYYSYILVIDPFGAARSGAGFFLQKLFSLCGSIGGSFGSYISDWLKEHKGMWKLLLQFGWGLFWASYVCLILCALLVFSFMFSGFLMSQLVEQPMQIREELNFDYTKNSPVAFVPLMSCGGLGCGEHCKEKIGDVTSLGHRVIPPNCELQVNVLLTLPESIYNRNLGIFQIRVDFLSASGKILTSKSHPCMLKFKSEPIRVLLTFLKIVPLIAGYVSESQTLELNIRGFTEREVPTSCLKVTIEQRAEYRPGAGIPEIYDASLVLESELPLFKRIIWGWKKTIFIWTSITLFMLELLIFLICCRPVIIPRPRQRDGSANNLPEQS